MRPSSSARTLNRVRGFTSMSRPRLSGLISLTLKWSRGPRGGRPGARESFEPLMQHTLAAGGIERVADSACGVPAQSRASLRVLDEGGNGVRERNRVLLPNEDTVSAGLDHLCD